MSSRPYQAPYGAIGNGRVVQRDVSRPQRHHTMNTTSSHDYQTLLAGSEPLGEPHRAHSPSTSRWTSHDGGVELVSHRQCLSSSNLSRNERSLGHKPQPTAAAATAAWTTTLVSNPCHAAEDHGRHRLVSNPWAEADQTIAALREENRKLQQAVQYLQSSTPHAASNNKVEAYDQPLETDFAPRFYERQQHEPHHDRKDSLAAQFSKTALDAKSQAFSFSRSMTGSSTSGDGKLQGSARVFVPRGGVQYLSSSPESLLSSNISHNAESVSGNTGAWALQKQHSNGSMSHAFPYSSGLDVRRPDYIHPAINTAGVQSIKSGPNLEPQKSSSLVPSAFATKSYRELLRGVNVRIQMLLLSHMGTLVDPCVLTTETQEFVDLCATHVESREAAIYMLRRSVYHTALVTGLIWRELDTLIFSAPVLDGAQSEFTAAYLDQWHREQDTWAKFASDHANAENDSTGQSGIMAIVQSRASFAIPVTAYKGFHHWLKWRSDIIAKQIAQKLHQAWKPGTTQITARSLQAVTFELVRVAARMRTQPKVFVLRFFPHATPFNETQMARFCVRGLDQDNEPITEVVSDRLQTNALTSSSVTGVMATLAPGIWEVSFTAAPDSPGPEVTNLYLAEVLTTQLRVG